MVKRLYTKNEAIEYRKIVKNGDSYVISIPKGWLDQNKIKLKDELACKITKNTIIITNIKLGGIEV